MKWRSKLIWWYLCLILAPYQMSFPQPDTTWSYVDVMIWMIKQVFIWIPIGQKSHYKISIVLSPYFSVKCSSCQKMLLLFLHSLGYKKIPFLLLMVYEYIMNWLYLGKIYNDCFVYYSINIINGQTQTNCVELL